MTDQAQGTDSQDLRLQVMKVVARFVQETHPGREMDPTRDAEARLEEDLGLDSMSRAELLLRVENALGVDLPDDALYAETPADIAEAVRAALGGPIKAAESAGSKPVSGDAAGEPAHAASLVEVLDWHVSRQPDRTVLHVYDQAHNPADISYAELDRGAAAVTGGLRSEGVRPGDRVALMLPTCTGYFFAFLGILRTGAVPVPIYPPARPNQLEEHLRRHGRILTNARCRLLITVPEARAVARLLRAEAPDLRSITTVEALRETNRTEVPVEVPGNDLAMLQYTSGSTGDPKGVMLTHAQLLANMRAMGERLGATSSDVFVSWLPLYHDMGLIAAWLATLYYGIPLAVMSPLSFLARPTRWLEMIHRHRGTISGSPNFGYELCLRAMERRVPEGLNLSCWRVAFNGAEPVSPRTMKRFCRMLAPCGLADTAMSPVYGLAEVAVGLCVPPPGRGAVLDMVDRRAFTARGDARPVTKDADALTFVNCGPPLAGYEIRVVDSAGREMPERREGDIEFRGPSATEGYFNNPEATAALRHGDWLRTGDRGYMVGADIHISGREKDMILRGGRNVYPYELEEAVGRIPGARKGCVAVFGNVNPESGVEELVVVAETAVADRERREELVRAIEAASVDVLGLPADRIRLVPPHSVLKTSSGKIRRAATRELYRRNRLGTSPRATWHQVMRLWLHGIGSRARVRVSEAASRVHAAYAWAVFALAALVVWIMAHLLPRAEWRWAVARGVGRLAAALARVRIRRQGIDNLPRRAQCVVVANHASYLDALVITVSLPRGFRHLAKAELGRRFFARRLLRRMDTLLVERFDLRQAAGDAERVTRAVRDGDSLAVFPEGTLHRSPGLHAFHMTPFIAAARAGVPVVPVALRGTRSVLRGSEWFPRPGRVDVTVGPPIEAGNGEWADAARARDAARAFILAHCGEPDLTGAQTAGTTTAGNRRAEPGRMP